MSVLIRKTILYMLYNANLSVIADRRSTSVSFIRMIYIFQKRFEMAFAAETTHVHVPFQNTGDVRSHVQQTRSTFDTATRKDDRRRSTSVGLFLRHPVCFRHRLWLVCINMQY